MRLLCLGFGYCARVLVQQHGPAFSAIAVTVRSAEAAAAAREHGLTPVSVDRDALETAMADADVWLISAPPGEDGDPLLRLVPHVSGAGRQIIYLSTVGVYGDAGGGWVDEHTPPAPVNARSRWRLIAERQWQGVGDCVAILRLPGIYGPGRSAFDSLRAGTAHRVIKPGQVFNRVHVDDIAGAVKAVIDHRFCGVLNVTDDLPAPPQDVVAHAAMLLGLPVPPDESFETAALSPMARSFYADNKRVANRRLTEALGYRLRHADYRAGLAAILAAER